MNKKVERNYLEINSIKDLNEANNIDDRFSIYQLKNPDFQINKFFYKNVGKKHNWVDRLTWTEKQWINYVFDKNIKTYILKDADDFAGYFELILHNDKNEIAYIKGVEDNYAEITNIDSALEIGNWLDNEFTNTAVIGRTIAAKLSLGIRSFGEPLSILVPKPGTGFINPNNAFYKTDVQIIGLYVGTEDFESKYVFVNLEQAKDLLKFTENQITGLELKLVDSLNADAVAEELQNELGTTFRVQTKEQLNEVFYKVINTENFVSYLIFTLIVIIALFNVIGTIIMMIIDKKANLKTLYNLGTTVKEIKKIFVLQGFLLTFFGMIIGLLIGIIAVFLQSKYGFFMITESLPYPVEFRFLNLFIVILTITVLGFIAAKIASSRINKQFIER